MTTTFDALHDTKTVLLTTFRRDGRGVDTPVSIAFDDGRAFFRTWHKAHKVARMARNPEVRVAPSTFRGEATGPAVPAHVRLLDGREARAAARALGTRHRFLQAVLVPLGHRMMRYRTMHYELLPDD